MDAHFYAFLKRKFGEEYADLCALPESDRIAVLEERWAHYDTPHDLLFEAGFQPEYFRTLGQAERFLASLDESEDA